MIGKLTQKATTPTGAGATGTFGGGIGGFIIAKGLEADGHGLLIIGLIVILLAPFVPTVNALIASKTVSKDHTNDKS